MPWIIVSIIQLVFFMVLIVAEVVGIAEADFWTLLVVVFFQLGGFAYGCYIFICVWSFRYQYVYTQHLTTIILQEAAN